MLGSRGRKKAMSIAIGPQPAKSAAGRQKYIDFMLLVQQYFRARMQPLPVFSDASLQKLIMPVLAVLGAKDAILDSAHTKRRLASNVPHSKIQYLDDVGHGIFGEKTAILEFLDRQTAARR
jgi:pimeloyl-ACP methyl ester carboxylesterase